MDGREGIIALVVAGFTAFTQFYQSYVKGNNDKRDDFRQDFKLIVANLKAENAQLKEMIEHLTKQNDMLNRKLNRALKLLKELGKELPEED